MKNYKEYKFSFENLDVYQKAIDLANLAFELTRRFRKEIQFSLGDQFRRAALSICNNLAEGSDQESQAAKIRFYAYALNSTRECIPMITIARTQGEIDSSLYEDLRARCVLIGNMISRLKRSVRLSETH